MNAESKTVNRLFWAIAAAVCFIAAGSFVWSFLALWELAAANSTQPSLGWVWPLITDLSMIVYTGGILVAQIQRRPARLPIGLTIFYSLVTIAGNVLHAPYTPLGWFVAIMPPLSLIFGTEMLRSMGHHIIERTAALATLAELGQQTDQQRRELATLLSQTEAASAKLTALKMDIRNGQIGENARSVQELQAAKQAKIDQRRDKVLTLVNGGMAPADISSELGVTVRTVKRDILALNGQVTKPGVTL